MARTPTNAVSKAVVSMDAMQKLIEAREEILIANWFTKDILEDLLGYKLTDGEFREILEHWHNSGAWNDVSDTVREWVAQEFERTKDGLKVREN